MCRQSQTFPRSGDLVISSLWWLPVTCPPRTSWHARIRVVYLVYIHSFRSIIEGTEKLKQ